MRRWLLLLGGFGIMGCQPPAEPTPQPAPRRTIPPTAVTAYRKDIIGYSVQNRPIERYFFPGDPTRAVLIIAAIHGSERASTGIAAGLIQLLQAQPQLARGRAVAIIPIANPDGYEINRRLNAHGVDLNRDFPAKNFKPGPRAKAALGEPESAALAQLIQQVHPKLLISIHAIDGARQCNNYDGPAKVVAEAMSRENGYPAIDDIGYPVPGSLGSWAGKELQIPMITLELPQGISSADAWRINQSAMLAALASG